MLLTPSLGIAVGRPSTGALTALGEVPLYFEANEGQADPVVKFIARGPGHTVFLTPTEAVFVLARRAPAGKRAGYHSGTADVVRMAFVGGDMSPPVAGRDPLRGKVNYFIGNDPGKWRANVATYAKVQYRDVYPGIDVLFYGNQRQLEYDIVVQPGANPDRVALRIDGAERLEVDGDGDLLIRTAGGTLRQRKPVVYQQIDGARRPVASGYLIKDNGHVAFNVGDYDRRFALVIDPVLVYSTYLGGSGVDHALGVAVDSAGNAYVTGQTISINFPKTPGIFQTTLGGGLYDAFVTKLDPTGSSLVYSTYVGGNGDDYAFAIVVDAAGNAYITGVTTSPNFPSTPGAFDTVYNGLQDAFATKLDPAGSALVYSTYIGGDRHDLGTGIAVDSSGNAYISGTTHGNFPTTPLAFQTAYGGGTSDAFVTKLNPAGSAQVYSTYLGGSLDDAGGGLALDAAGNVYATGVSLSDNFPTTLGAFQTTHAGLGDAFVTKLNPTGGALIYSTYLGGTNRENGGRLAVDADGNAYVGGHTFSSNFPTTPGAFQTTYGGGIRDAFVTKLNPTGSAPVYSTYLGGSGDEQGDAIAVDLAGNVYVAGFTDSAEFPRVNAIQNAFGGGLRDAFVTKINPTGTGLVYSTYLGGAGDDVANAVALDALPIPNAYVVGGTTSTDFPTTPGAFGTSSAGNYDAFVAKISPILSPVAWGLNDVGQLGDGTTASRFAAAPVSGLTDIVAISGGDNHSLAATGDGDVRTWGSNQFGQLGDGTVTDRHTPVPVAGLSGVIDVAGGLRHSLALKSDGTVWAWGLNASGQLGNGTVSDSSTPVMVSGLTNAVAIAAGGDISFALTSDGNVFAWGFNADGQLGNGTTTNNSVPFQVSGLGNAAAIAAGSSHGLALKPDGTVWAWGLNVHGQLGDGMFESKLTPVQVIDPGDGTGKLQGIVGIAAGSVHSLALKSDGTVRMWGDGMGSGSGSPTPSPVAVPTDIIAIAAGNGFSLALRSDGTVWGWGLNNRGQLGSQIVDVQLLPVPAPGLASVAAIAAGGAHGLALVPATTSASADVSVTMVAAPPTGTVGTNLTFAITVTNNGPNDATAVVLSDALPGTMTFVSATPSQGSCSGTSTVTCSLGGLASGANATVSIVVTPTAAGGFNNTATVSSVPTDPNAANDSATVLTVIASPPPPPVVPGGISGKVTKDDGTTAIQGATVTLFPNVGGSGGQTTTQADGTYSFTGLNPATYKVQVQADGYATVFYSNKPVHHLGDVVTVTSGATTTGIDFELDNRAGTISGRVTRQDGVTGISGANVNVSLGSGGFVLSVTTNTNGDFTTGRRLAPGTYVLESFANGYVNFWYDQALSFNTATRIAVNNGTESSVIYRLGDSPGGLKGRVTDAVTDAGIAGAGLSLHTLTNDYVSGAGTATDGTYDFGRRLAPGTYNLQVNADGHLRTTVPVIIAADIDTIKDVELLPGGGVTGQVKDGAGTPIVGAVITVFDATTNNFLDGNFVTDAAGNYTLNQRFAPGARIKLQARAAGHVTQYYANKPTSDSADAVTVPAAGTDLGGIDFTMVPGADISGRITEAGTNAVIPGAYVEVFDAATGRNVDCCFTVDSAGNYTTEHRLPAATYKVLARAPGHAARWWNGQRLQVTANTITVAPGADATNKDFALPVGGWITGKVTSGTPAGPPVDGALICPVDATTGQGTFECFTSKPDGTYTTDARTDPGTYKMQAQKTNFATQWFDAKPDSASADVVTVPVSSWETKAPMLGGARTAVGVGVVDDLLYAIGGFSDPANSHSVVATVEAYDPATDTWSGKAPLTSARRGAGVGVLGSRLYVVGGDVTEDPLTTFEAYDPVTGTWISTNPEGQPLPPMPTARESLAVTVVDNVLYAIGGRGPGFGPRLKTVEAYDPIANTWTTKAEMPTARQAAAVAVVDGIIYVIGGDDFPTTTSHVVYSTVEAYDPATNTWTTKASMPAPRNGHAAAAIGGLIFVAGGANDGGVLASAYAYDPSTDTWTEVLPIGIPRYNVGGAAVGDRFYVVGGQSSIHDALEAFTPSVASNVNFVLQTGGGIVGSVTNTSGAPLEGARIDVLDANGQGVACCYFTGSDGRYTVPKILASGNYRTRAELAGYVPGLSAVVTVVSGEPDPTADISLVTGGGVSGIVTGPAGPIAGAEINVYNFVTGHGVRNFTTGANGTYDTQGMLAAGTYKVAARAAGHVSQYFNGQPDQSTANAVVVNAGFTTPNINFTLVAGANITGKITANPGGAAIPFARVDIYHPDGLQIECCLTADADGMYSAGSRLAPGSYRVRAQARGFGMTFYVDEPTVLTANPVVVGTGGTAVADIALPAGGSFKGMITSDGVPVAGAQLLIFDATTNRFIECCGFEYTSRSDGSFNTGRIFRAGTYKIQVRATGFVSTYVPNALNIDGAAILSITAGDDTTVNIALQRGGAIKGTITGTTLTGTTGPIVGARVDIFDANNFGFGAFFTDANGQYDSGRTLAAGSYKVRVQATGFITKFSNGARTFGAATADVTVTTDQDTTFDANLLPGGTITGTVRRASDNSVVNGAIIDVFDSANGYVDTFVAGSNGVYTTAGSLAAVSYKVSARGPGLVTLYHDNKKSVNAADLVGVALAGETTIDFVLPAGRTVSGQITTGDPPSTGVANARVEFFDSATGEFVLSVNSNSDGFYSTESRLFDGTYKIKIVADGFFTTFHDGKATFNTANPFVVTSDAQLDVSLTPGGMITGNVSGPAGPLMLATVQAEPTAAGGTFESAQTDINGDYTIRRLATGNYRLRAFGEGVITEWFDNRPSNTGATLVPAGNPTSGKDFVLAGGAGGFRGRVTDTAVPEPNPIVNANVCVSFANGTGFVNCFRTDTNGEYGTGLQLAPGAYRANVALGGFATMFNGGARSFSAAPPIVVNPAVHVENVNFALPRPQRISGRITQEARVEIFDATLFDTITAPGALTSVNTDGNGNYTTAQVLAPGTYKVKASRAGFIHTFHVDGIDFFTATTVTVPVGADVTGIDVALRVGGSITGTIGALNDDGTVGAPIQGATVNLNGVASSLFFGTFSATTDALGVFTISGLHDGEYLITANPPPANPSATPPVPQRVVGWYSGDANKPATDFSTATSVFITGANTVGGRDINLRAGGGSISGRITRHDNDRPVRVNTSVAIRGPLPRTSSIGVSALTDVDGNYTARGLPAGVYVVEANPIQNPDGTAGGFYPFSATARGTGLPVTVTEGSTTTGIDFQVYGFSGGEAPRTITGSLSSDPDGAPVTSAFIFVLDPSAQSLFRTGTANADGTFLVNGLPPARFVFSANTPSGHVTTFFGDEKFVPAATTVNLTEGNATGKTINLPVNPGRMSGRVVRADTGEPIPGAGVSIRNFFDNGVTAGGLGGAARPDGTWLARGLPPGFYKGRVTAPGFITRYYTGSPDLTAGRVFESGEFIEVVAGEETSDVDIALEPALGEIRGKVLLAESATPPAVGGSVQVRDKVSGSTVATVTIVADGSFVMKGLAPGTYKLRFASGTGAFATTWHGGQSFLSASDVIVGAGSTDIGPVTVSTISGAISGTIFSNGTTLLPDAGVVIFDRIDGGFVAGGGVTGKNGVYTVRGLAPGTDRYAAQARALGFDSEFFDQKTTVGDATALSVSAGATTSLVNFTLDGKPTAFPQSVSTPEDTSVPIVLQALGGTSLSFTVISGPANGTLSGVAPTLSYTPAAHFNGTDSFQFAVGDGTATSAPATVSITVTAVNDPPVFDAIANQTVVIGAEVQSVTITGVAPGPAAATDEAGQTVTLTATSSNPAVVPNPTISGTGATRTLTYVPPTAEATVTITVTANDGQAVNNIFSRTFTIIANVSGIVNQVPVALGQTVTTTVQAPVNLVLAGTDAETAPSQLTYMVTSGPTDGTLSASSGRSLTYTPGEFTSTASFTFTVTDRGNPDGCGATSPTCAGPRTSAPATVTIVVNPAETTVSAPFTTFITAPPFGGVASAPQALGDVAINEKFTGSLSTSGRITLTLPSGLTFAAKPFVSTPVGNGLVLALEGGTPGQLDSPVVFSFAIAQRSTTGAAKVLISGISVVVAPGFTGEVESGFVKVTVGGTNPGVTTTLVTTATAVLEGATPVLEAVAPARAARGVQGYVLTLTGVNFATGASVAVSGGGVTMGVATVDSSTQIRVPISVDVAALLGPRDVTVTQTGDDAIPRSSTLAAALTITPPPTVVATDRDAANPLRRGRTTQRVNVSGAGFDAPTTSPPNLFIEIGGGAPFVSDPLITVEAVGFTNTGSVWADVSVTFDAALGARSVRVVNPDGGVGVSVAGAVDVQDPTPETPPTLNAPPAKTTTSAPTPPSISALLPEPAARLGTSITISGTDFSGTPTSNSVTFAGSNNTRVAAEVTGASTTSLSVTVPTQAVDGDVTVAVGGQVSNAVAFTVTSPRLSSVIPSSGEQGTVVDVQLSGSKFAQGAQIAVLTADGVPVTGLGISNVVVSPTLITAQFSLTAPPAVGVYDVRVTNPDSGSATLPGGFEVRLRSDVRIEIVDATNGALLDNRAYLPSVGAVSVTLDGTGVCTSKSVTGVPVFLRATYTGPQPAPAQLRFVIESSTIPGTATNEDCESGAATPDFSIETDGNPNTFVDVAGAGLYTTRLWSRDMGGTVTVRVLVDQGNNNFRELGLLRLPADSDNDGLPDAWEQQVALNANNADENGNGVLDDDDKFVRDGLTNFEKFRGVWLAGPAKGTTGTMTGHERLDPHRRHLFVRARGYADDPAIVAAPGTCGWDRANDRAVADAGLSPSNPCPRFEVGTAFDAQGIRVVNVTPSFVTGRELPQRSMSDPTRATLDLLTIVYDGVTCNGGEACDQTAKSGIRQWAFPTLGVSNYGGATTFGSPRIIKRAIDAYFHNRPYEHRANDPTRVVLGPNGRPMLAPITLVGDGNDNGLLDRREATVNGELAGDAYIVGAFNLQLSALDVNTDGCIELPAVADPTVLTDCDPTAPAGGGAQATKQQVVRHVTTHEIGHAVGINLHTTDADDVMYQYSINWTRDNHFGPTAAGLIQIHNKGQQ